MEFDFMYVLQTAFACSKQQLKHQNVAKNCSKLTIKSQGQSHWRRSGVIIFDFQQFLHIVLMLPLLFLSKCRLDDQRF